MNQVLGHEWAAKILSSAIESGRVPHAVLITGIPNIGKTSLARSFAQALNCEKQSGIACGECLACRKIARGTHPDVRTLEAPFPATGSSSSSSSQTLRINHVRELQRELSLSPYEGLWRVAILCEFERATQEAANALLKTLEEPPPHVVLVLTALEADALLPTIVSRCQVLALRPLSMVQIREALVTGWRIQESEAELLAHLAGGRLGWAVQAAEDGEILERRNRLLDDLVSLSGKSRVERLAYASRLSESLSRRNDPDYPRLARETLHVWAGWWRDVLMVSAGSTVPVTNVDRTDILHRHAKQLTLCQTQQVVSQLQSVIQNLDSNVNLQLALEVTLLSLPSLV